MEWFLYDNGLCHEKVKDITRPYTNSMLFNEINVILVNLV